MNAVKIALFDVHQAHKALMQLWPLIKAAILDGKRLHLELRQEKRSDPQNRRMWAMLGDIAVQVEWYGQRLNAEEWKDVLTAALKKQKVVPGIDGGFVIIGARTSKMTKAEMTELQELMEAFGSQQGVRFSAPEERVAA
jgi:NinB protein